MVGGSGRFWGAEKEAQELSFFLKKEHSPERGAKALEPILRVYAISRLIRI